MEEESTELPGTDGLAPKQRHQAKHRELFLSRHVETLPATHIRGKCTVTLLNETESLLSYLNKDVSMYRKQARAHSHRQSHGRLLGTVLEFCTHTHTQIDRRCCGESCGVDRRFTLYYVFQSCGWRWLRVRVSQKGPGFQTRHIAHAVPWRVLEDLWVKMACIVSITTLNTA